MGKLFFILFLLIPAIELYVLIEVGGMIGGLVTILLVILTAFVGATLMRGQGLATMQKAQMSMQAGQVPRTEMVEGGLIFVGGLLLLVPGFITDSLGLLLLVPQVRHAIATSTLKHQSHRSGQSQVYETEWSEKTSDMHVHTRIHVEPSDGERFKKQHDQTIIDAEFTDLNKPKD